MAKPVYLLCCESQSVDVVTGLISHFNVFNNLQISQIVIGQPVQLAPNFTVWLRMIASATWMREEGDEEYEYQTVLQIPGQQELIVAQGRFKFTKPFQRIDSHVQGPQFNQPGICFVESRIRKVGEQTWLSQRYPILLEVSVPAQPGPS